MTGELRTHKALPIPVVERFVEGDELLSILECPVCRELPFPPIYTCTEGHMVCSDCRPKLSHCGLCKQHLSSKRNYPVEAIVLNSRFCCPYRNFGCLLSIKGDNYRAHIDVCTFRPIICYQTNVVSCLGTPLNYCVQDFIKHLNNVHHIYVSSQDRDFFATSEWTNELASGGSMMSMVLKYDGKHFFKNCQTLNLIRYWWISLLGTEKEAEEYHTKITLTNTKNMKVPKAEWTIPVHSFRKSFKEVLENGYYASVSLASLKNFCLLDQKKDDKVYKFHWSTHFLLSKSKSSSKPKVTSI